MIYRVFMTDEDYVVIDADSPEEAMLKLRDAGLEHRLFRAISVDHDVVFVGHEHPVNH